MRATKPKTPGQIAFEAKHPSCDWSEMPSYVQEGWARFSQVKGANLSIEAENSCACCLLAINGPVQCAACVNLDEKRMQDLMQDRDEWKKQHENALACWRADVAALSARYWALSKATKYVIEAFDATTADPYARAAIEQARIALGACSIAAVKDAP